MEGIQAPCKRGNIKKKRNRALFYRTKKFE